jgi:hypothetical protein
MPVTLLRRSVFLFFVSALLSVPCVLVAETLTVPAVASFPLGTAQSPFFSDVRVFNTSYASPVSVTAVYRCFLGACPGVGVYNGNDTGVAATIRLYDGSTLLGTQTVNLGPRSGTQINRIFDAMGQAGRTTSNAFAVVESGNASAPLFTYAAVIDNATSDSSFVSGAEDERRPEPQTITVNVKAWDFSPGGPNSPPLVLTVGTTYILVFHNVDSPGTPSPRHGFSGISDLGLAGTDDISPGHDVTLAPFTPQPFQRGTYPFICTQNECGGDPEQHRGMQGNILIQ